MFTIPTAQKLFDREGKLDAISVAAKAGISQDALVERDPQRSCRPRSTVRTATAQAKEAPEAGLVHEDHPLLPARVRRDRALRRRVRHLQHALDHGRAADPRVRDPADDRRVAAAAARRSVTLEALVIGVLASIVGLVGGLLLARGLNALFKASNNDLPTTVPEPQRQDRADLARRRDRRDARRRHLPGDAGDEGAADRRRPRGGDAPAGAGSRSTRRSSRWSSSPCPSRSSRTGSSGTGCRPWSACSRSPSAASCCSSASRCVSPRLVPKLAGGLRPVAKWVMFVGALFVYPIRIGTWLVRAALFGGDLGAGTARAEVRRRRPAHAPDRAGHPARGVMGPGCGARQGAVLFRCSERSR